MSEKQRSESPPKTKRREEGLASRLLPWVTPTTMIPLTVAIIGLLGQQVLKEREGRLKERSMLEQKSQLFVQLMSKREESESSLRMNMFTAILGEFFKEAEDGDEVRSISKRLLKLEMLALNFGESLSLSPMFRELERDLENHGPKPGERWTQEQKDDWIFEKWNYENRLRKLAKRVANWQMTALEQPGAFFDFEVTKEQADEGVTAKCGLDLEGVRRLVTITLTDPNVPEQTVQANVVIERFDGEVDSQQPCAIVETSEGDLADFRFELSWFDFPMIDNTRLDRDHRFALILTTLHPDEVEVSGAIFPGLYGSQRNKPFLDIVLEQLPNLLAQSDEQTAGGESG